MAVSPRLIAEIDTLALTLLHFLWQGALIGALYFTLRNSCRSAAARYRLGLLMLLALALSPALTLTYLQSVAVVAGGQASHTTISLGTFQVVAAQSRWHLQALLPWLVALWLCGVLLLAMRSLREWSRLLRIVAQAEALATPWGQCLRRLCQRYGLQRPVRLLCSGSISTPILVGWIRPAILLPASMFSGFSVEQLELVIAHELAHVRRWDYLVNLLQVLVETVLFYHPVVHWISRDVRNAREECCDDLVVGVAHGNPLVYAQTLADLEDMRHEPLSAVPALGFSGGVLLSRVRRIVGAHETNEPLPRSYGLPLLLLAAMVCVIAWRPRPTQIDVARVLSNASTHALALVSGNPDLALDRPSLKLMGLDLPIQPAVPVPHLDIATSANVDSPAQAPSGSPDETVRIARPGVHLAAATLPRPADVISSPRLSMPAMTGDGPQSASSSIPQPLQVVAPVYPSRAMAQGIAGSVELEFHVTGNGHVSGIRVLTSEPVGIFDAAAITALQQWRFPDSTAHADAKSYTQKFSFNLNSRNSVRNAADCRHITGTMLCRHPDD